MNKKILRLAIPNVISNITVPLLGMVDVGLMGHLGSQVYIGAIAIATMIFNIIFWAFGFLRMGSSGFTAQAYGRRDFPEAVMVFARSITLAVISGIAIILLQKPIAFVAFGLIGVNNEMEIIASSYYYIRIYTAPATIALTAIIGWLIGMQNARTPMAITILVNAVNIAYSFFFVIVLGMKAEGIAWGSLLAQYTGLIFALWMVHRHYGKLFRTFKAEKLKNLQPFINFLAVNKDIFIRTLLIIVVISFFTFRSAKLGDAILAGNTLLYQFFIFFSYFMDGFAYAAESLVGKYYGANDKLMLEKTVKKLFVWGGGICLSFTLIYFLFGKMLLPLLTNNKETILIANTYFYWVYLIPLVTFSAFLWDGIYVGCTASAAMRNAMIISTIVLFFPLYFFVLKGWGNNGLWLAFIIFLASRGLLLQWQAKKQIYS
ncbi:MAG: MATE family efflux transporter [Bacteroidetes bacterium]|nr:MATE family efflux transporter [Bacteroidota bacterium]